MVAINLLLLSLIVVYVIDISGAVDSLKSGIKWLLTGGKMRNSNYSLKPIDCSLCSVFWGCLAYLFLTNNLTLPHIAYTCILSCFSGVIKSTILFLEDIANKIIQIGYKYLIDNEDNNV